MTERHDEERIRAEFARLRSATEGADRVPDFTSMLARAKADAPAPPLEVLAGGAGHLGAASERTLRAAGRRRALLPAAWASVAVAATFAGLLLVNGRGAEVDFERVVLEYARDGAGGAWRSPTSSLLEVPGSELIRTVPSVGGVLPPSGRDARGGTPGGRGS